MHSSPATPIGTGGPAGRARRPACWRSAARSAPRPGSPCSTRAGRRPDRRLGRPVQVPQLAARAPAGARASSAGSASPPHSIFSPGPARSSPTRAAAATSPALPASPSPRGARAAPPAPAPSVACSREAITTCAPADQRQEQLQPRDVEATASSPPADVRPPPAPAAAASTRRKLQHAPCSICTPFGRPVEPDV